MVSMRSDSGVLTQQHSISSFSLLTVPLVLCPSQHTLLIHPERDFFFFSFLTRDHDVSTVSLATNLVIESSSNRVIYPKVLN